MNARRFYFLVLAALMAGVLYEGYFWLKTTRRQVQDAWGAVGQPAAWRGANFSQNGRLADYILFLNASIPPAGRVVLPPGDIGPWGLSSTPFMQFFLAPRKVINCNDLACLQELTPANTYFLITGPATAETLLPDPGQIRMYDENWGVQLPPDAQPGQPLTGFRSFVDLGIAILGPSLWLICLAFSGFLFVRLLSPQLSWLAQAGLGYGLGLSFFSLLAAILSLAGLPFGPGLLVTSTAIQLILGVWAGWKARFWKRLSLPVLPSLERGDAGWVLLTLALTLVAAGIGVGQGYHVTDEIVLWGVKGYGIASAGSVKAVQDWGTNTVAYPLHLPVLIAGFRVLNGDPAGASKLLFSGYYGGLLALLYVLLRGRSGRSRWIAGLSVLLVGLSPLVFRHGTLAYANLPLSYYLLGAVFLLFGVSDEGDTTPDQERIQWRVLLLSGLFFAFSAWVRPEGLLLSVLFLFLSLGWERFARRRASLRPVWSLALPLALYTLFWFILRALVYNRPTGQAGLSENALAALGSGNFHLAEGLYVIRTALSSLTSVQDWGVFGLAAMLAFLAALALPARRQRAVQMFIILGAGYLIAILGMYYLTSYDTTHDISWWVNTGLDRMALPGVLFLWAGGMRAIQCFYDCQHTSIPRDRI